MLKLLSIGFLFLISSSLFSQKELKDFQLKRAVRLEGLHCEFRVLDEDKRNVKHFKKDRLYYWFKAQKLKQTYGGASGTLLDGLFESFYASKQLAEKGHFKRGLKNGEWRSWNPEGELLAIVIWKNGKIKKRESYSRDGEILKQEKNGCFLSSIKTKDSLWKQSVCRKYTSNRIYDEELNVVSLNRYKNGEKHGVCKTFDEKGKVISKMRYKNGVKVEKKEKVVKEKEEKPAQEKEKDSNKEKKEKKNHFKGWFKKKDKKTDD